MERGWDRPRSRTGNVVLKRERYGTAEKNSVSQLALQARAQMAAPASGKQRGQAGAVARSKTKGKPGGAGGGGVGRGIGAGIGEAGAAGTWTFLRVEGREEAEEGESGEGQVTRGSGAWGRAAIGVEEIWEECPGGRNLKGGGNCGEGDVRGCERNV